MKVHVVVHDMGYDGQNNVAVFSSHRLAFEWASADNERQKKLCEERGWNFMFMRDRQLRVEEWEVDAS